MKSNTTTNKGIYLGFGINPFPSMHCFATTSNKANKTFLHSLDGVKEISREEFDAKENATNKAKESFFSHFTA
jgi:hypothetical protein